jgi:hypothetical protein
MDKYLAALTLTRDVSSSHVFGEISMGIFPAASFWLET